MKKNKTQKEREEMREEFFKRFTYGGKTGIVAIEKSSFEVWNWIEKALSQQKEEVRREVLERLRGLLLVDDWQPLYSEALSEVDKKSLIEELEKSLETK